MVCIGIPVLRPLWRKVLRGTTASTDRYYKHGDGADVPNSDVFHMKAGGVNGDDNSTAMRSLDTRAETYSAYRHESDEEILGPEFRQGQTFKSRGPGSIHVTDDVRVDIGPRPS